MVNKNLSVKIVEGHRSVIMVKKKFSVKSAEEKVSVNTVDISIIVKSVTQRSDSIIKYSQDC